MTSISESLPLLQETVSSSSSESWNRHKSHFSFLTSTDTVGVGHTTAQRSLTFLLFIFFFLSICFVPAVFTAGNGLLLSGEASREFSGPLSVAMVTDQHTQGGGRRCDGGRSFALREVERGTRDRATEAGDKSQGRKSSNG